MNIEFNKGLSNRSSKIAKDRYSSHKDWNTAKRSHAEKMCNKSKKRKSIRRNWADVKKDLDFMDDLNIDSIIHDEIESIFHEPAYPEADWQRLERLGELAELKEFFSDFEYR